ncbi:MAG: hypothetical protein JW820_07445 [Spirochaetales bacterium]|nr:hypothetical protein [Spirochaetales bacterium]
MIRTRASTTTVFVLALLLGGAAAGATPSLASLVPAPVLERLQAGEEVTRTLWGSKGPELVPAIPMATELMRELQSLEITVGVEMLRLYDGASESCDTESSRLTLYNILRSVSSMEGIQYYSASRDRMRTLFAVSHAIDGPDTQARVPDPLVSEVPEYGTAYMLQEDLTFGRNLYRAEYLAREYGFVLKIYNLTEMRYYFLPMVKPEGSLTIMLVVPHGRQILFYSAMAAHTPSLFGIERSREESFYNRLNALYGWFVREVSGALDGD